MSRIDGVIKSSETKYIMLNAPKNKVEAITELLPGSDAPTIIPLAGSDELVALQAVCTENIFWETFIMSKVKSGGDKAVSDFTAKFDGISSANLRVPPEYLKQAWLSLPKGQRNAINVAKKNIEKFHQAQRPVDIEVETIKGVICRRESRPIATAGLYVPGGTAPLVSTLLMLAVPAKVAGVKRRVIVTPPSNDGKINQAILAAAYRCKVTDVFACGGAQAIAALTYGTKTIPKCDKIFGPGNAYVATAKSIAAQEPGGPAIDMPAGPSEAMVVANSDANPAFVASDLLSQAEHDTLAQVICVSTSQKVADSIKTQIDTQIATLPRKNIAEQAMSKSRMIIATNRTDIVDIINRYAPEHLILRIGWRLCQRYKSHLTDIWRGPRLFRRYSRKFC